MELFLGYTLCIFARKYYGCLYLIHSILDVKKHIITSLTIFLVFVFLNPFELLSTEQIM